MTPADAQHVPAPDERTAMPRLALALFVAAAVCFAIALVSNVSDDVQVLEYRWVLAAFTLTALALVAERWPS